MRTGITYKGNPALAICLKHLAVVLPHSRSYIEALVKSANMGKRNVTKDFVPRNSTNTKISRTTNGISRKCLVVCLEQLPPLLQEKLKNSKFLYMECMHCVFAFIQLFSIQ